MSPGPAVRSGYSSTIRAGTIGLPIRSAWQATRLSRNMASIPGTMAPLDDTYISDPMKISIDVKNLTGSQA